MTTTETKLILYVVVSGLKLLVLKKIDHSFGCYLVHVP